MLKNKVDLVMWFRSRNFLPDLSILIIFLVVSIYTIHIGYWKRNDKIISKDVLHYYAYLPATFIYHDITLDFVFENPDNYRDKFWPVISPVNKNVIMVTMGMSMLYAPSFLITRMIMLLHGDDSDGFSPPYRVGLIIGGIVYLILSLFFLKRILLRYFSSITTAISLIMIVLGTNLGHYVTQEVTMSHLYSFFLFTVFLYLTILWHENPKSKYAILLGLTIGLIVLVRPSNILAGLVFVFWNISDIQSFKDKWNLFRKQYFQLIAILLFAIIIWIPQLIYWKYLTGTFFFYGYGEESRFFFGNPQIFNNLFSYRKGWLIYTPIMILAFTGLFIMWKQKRGMLVPLVIFTILNIYVVSSWWSWWYGGGFGMRAYVETYAFYSLGFAAFVQWILNRRCWLTKIPLFLLIAVLISFNLFQTRQYYYGSIHYVGMTEKAYWHQFLKLEPYGNFYDLLTIPDMQKARMGVYEYLPVNAK
jgi:MFS family permease